MLFGSLVAAQAQSDFRAYSSSEVMLEGGRVDKLIAVTGNFQFSFQPPRGWYRQVEDSNRKITFSSASRKSALTVQFTTNSPGTLPETDTLRAQVLREHPGASVIQSTVCPGGDHPGLLFDLVSLPAPRVVEKYRHAFMPEPIGTVEICLSASDDEFDKDKYIFMAAARGLRAQRLKQQ